MTSSFRARSAIGIAALLLTPLLVGCNDEEDPPEPMESPTTSRSTSTPSQDTTTPTAPVEPTLPAAAENETRTGVEAFVRHYWDVVNYATRTGDVERLAELDQPSCEGCSAGIRGLTDVYDRGGRIIGGDYTVTRIRLSKSANGPWLAVTHTRVERQRTIGAGDLNRTFPAGEDMWLMALARVNGAWSVATLESK